MVRWNCAFVGGFDFQQTSKAKTGIFNKARPSKMPFSTGLNGQSGVFNRAIFLTFA
jgi:hypothetical protein